MMMKTMRYLFGIFLITVVAACDSVVVDEPFGDLPTTINEEEWAGHWYIDDDEIYRARILNAEEGIVEIARIEDSDDGLTIDKSKIYLRESGDWKFMFIPAEDGEEGYVWYKYENHEGKVLMLWTPSVEKFKEAVERGLLQGEVRTKRVEGPEGKPLGQSKHTTVLLKNIGKEEIDIIKSEDNGIFFDWQNPIPIMKVKE